MKHIFSVLIFLFASQVFATDCHLFQGLWQFKTFLMHFENRDCKSIKISVVSYQRKLKSQFELELNNVRQGVVIHEYSADGSPSNETKAEMTGHFAPGSLDISIIQKDPRLEYLVQYEVTNGATQIASTVTYIPEDKNQAPVVKSTFGIKVR